MVSVARGIEDEVVATDFWRQVLSVKGAAKAIAEALPASGVPQSAARAGAWATADCRGVATRTRGATHHSSCYGQSDHSQRSRLTTCWPCKSNILLVKACRPYNMSGMPMRWCLPHNHISVRTDARKLAPCHTLLLRGLWDGP